MMPSESLSELVTAAEGTVAQFPERPASHEEVPGSLAASVEQSWFLRSAKDYAKDKATGERVRAVLWWVSGLSLLLNCVLAGALAHVALRTKVVPYIVQVDEHGYAVPIQQAEATSLDDPRLHKVVIRDLSDWIRAWRTVVADSAAQRALVVDVYEMIPKGTAARDKVLAWYAEHPPYASKGRTVDAEIHFVGPISESVWKVEWTERERLASSVAKSARFSALMTIAFSPTTNFEDIKVNALGIYVTDVSAMQMKAAQ